MIREINDLVEVLQSDAKLFFFDLEETIVAPNIFYDLIGYKEYCQVFLDLCKDVKIFDVTYLGKNYKRVLMQKDIPKIINSIKEKGAKVLALTSGYPSHQKKTKIKELDVKFDGYLFTRGGDKGPFLVKFLSINNLTGKCSFVDNHYEKVMNVKDAFDKEFPNENKIDLFLYKREFIHNISMQDFIDYWKSVIEGVKNGEVERLKMILQREREKKLRMKKKQEEEILNNKN
ncbi:MAG: hypothetical protein ACK5XN_13485 [Bacteroidota bacterium]